MLFDLRGKRQGAVKVVYLTLALLMGGGLVFFGIGGSVSGGLLDAFQGGGNSSAEDAIQDRIDSAEQKLQQNPKSTAPLKVLVRANYQLATAQVPSGSSGFPPEAQDDLKAASDYWQRYLKIEKGTADASLAGLAAQLYGPDALNRPPDVQEAYRVIAERRNDVESYLLLVSAATTAGDRRTADLAAVKAIDLAPKKARKAVEKQVKAIKKQAKQQAAGAQGGS